MFYHPLLIYKDDCHVALTAQSAVNATLRVVVETLVIPRFSAAKACAPREEAAAVGVLADWNGFGAAMSGLFNSCSCVHITVSRG